MPRRYPSPQRNKRSKRLQNNNPWNSSELSIKDALAAILAGFGVGGLMVLTSFLFFYSAIIRIAVFVGLSSWKNYRKIVSVSKSLAILSFVKIVGEQLGRELATHFIEQRRRWKHTYRSKTKVRVMCVFLLLDILWAVLAIKMNEVFFRQGIH
jgi:hypothetical protein